MYQPPTDILARVGVLIRDPLPEENLASHLRELEAVRLSVAIAVVDWMKLLYEKREQFRHPKDKDLTDWDRNTMLHSAVAVIERDYELLKRIETIITERIELGKIFLTTTV
jgi:hypothetical protein